LEFYLGQFASDLNKIIDEHLEAFWNAASGENSTVSNRQHYEANKEAFTKLLAQLSAIAARLETRLKVIEAKNSKMPFAPTNQGEQAAFDLINEYRAIQKRLFGSQGFAFMSFFVGQLDREIKNFQQLFARLRARLFTSEPSPRELSWDCRNAQQMRVLWESARTSAEVSLDFIDTNIGIFHRDFSAVRWFLYFLPIGHSYQLHLFRMVKSAEYARAVLARTEVFDRTQIKHSGWNSSLGLGRLMLELVGNEEKREQVEEFWQKNNCLKFL
jgi:hypothetical protein